MNRIVLALSFILAVVGADAQPQRKKQAPMKRAAVSFVVNASGATAAYDNPATTENEAADGVCADANGECTITAAIEEADNMAVELGVDAVPVHLTFAVPLVSLPAGLVLAPHPGSVIEGGKIAFATRGEIRIEEGTITGSDITDGELTLYHSVIQNSTVLFNPLFGVAGGGIALELGSTMDSVSVTNGTVGLNDDGNTVTRSTIAFTTAAGAGITVGGNDNTVQQTAVTGAKAGGIVVGGSFNTVTGNRIGVSPSGTPAPNSSGILVTGDEGGGSNTIEGNIVSGNTGDGIVVQQSDGNLVRDNTVGLNGAENSPRPNGGHGISVTGAANTVIERNVIAGNGGSGVLITGADDPVTASSNTVVKNNFIGVNRSEAPFPNGANGVQLAGNAHDNVIGSPVGSDADSNVIAYHPLQGILVQASPGHLPMRNTFRRNRQYHNAQPGVLLQPSVHGGIQPAVIDSLGIIPESGEVVVYGTGVSGALIDVYGLHDLLRSEGEGKQWMQRGTADGQGRFAVNIGVRSMACTKLTVLQTGPTGNTSSYALNRGMVPSVIRLTEQCAPPLFSGVSYASNTYIVHIDWKSLPKEGEILFSLNGQQKPGTIQGDIATVEYNMNQTVTGMNTLTWSLTDCIGQTAAGLNQHQFCGTPVPSWLEPVTASCGNGHMHYTRTETFPDVPGAAAAMGVPPSMAFIGGLALSFAGAPSFTATLHIPGDSEPVEADAAFDIGDFRTRVAVTGTAHTAFAGCDGVDVSGTLSLTASVAKDYTYGFSFGTVPCPPVPGIEQLCQMANAVSHSLRIGATLSGEITGTATLTDGIAITGGSGGATLALRPFLDLVPFHARGNGQLAFAFDVPSFSVTSVTPSLSLTIYEDITGSSKTWTFPSLLLASGDAPERSERAVRRPDAPYRAVSLPAAGPDTTVAVNIAWNARPDYATGPGGVKAFVWTTYRTSGGKRVSDIAVKLFNGTAWTEPLALTADDAVDRNPTVAVDGAGTVIVSWERSSLAQPFPDSLQYAVTVSASMDVRTAAVSTSTGTVIAQQTLGWPDRADLLPRLARGKDGTVMLAWQTGSGQNLFGTDADPVRFAVARQWTGAGWSSVDTLPAAQSKAFQWDFAVHDAATAVIALSKDMHGDLSSGGDWDVFALKRSGGVWGSEVRVTDNAVMEHGVRAAYAYDGTPVIVWLRDTSVVGSYGAVSSSQEVWLPRAGLGFAKGVFAAGKDTMALVWNEGSALVIATAPVAQRTWSPPSFLHFTTDIQRPTSASFDPEGTLQIGFLQTPYQAHPGAFSDSGALHLVTLAGVSSPLPVEPERAPLPQRFALFDAYPNPFNASAVIRFALPARGYTVLTVTNILGHEVSRLADGPLEAGEHSVRFSADRLSSGVYFYTLRSNGIIQTKKMLLLK